MDTLFREIFRARNLVQDLLNVADEVGGDEDGALLVVVGEDGIEDEVPGGGVHACDGFVQQVPGPQRQRQDHPHQDPLRPAPAHRGGGAGPAMGSSRR